MIKIPLKDMLAKISEKTGLSEQEINSRVDQKLTELKGLVSRDGAVHIVANELGIKLVDYNGRQKIKDIYAGMRNVEVVGRVTTVFEQREFQRSDQSSGKVGSFVLGDETGTIRIVCWGSQGDVIKQLAENSIVLVSGGYTRESRTGFKEIHMNDQSRITVNPPGEQVGEVRKRQDAARKSIKELADGDTNVELLGTVVQIFDPRFFETCPQCSKKLKQEENSSVCAEHGAVSPAYSPILNLVLDDGSDSIRCVFFAGQIERIIGKNREQMLAYRDNPQAFEEVKTELLGNMIKVVGRANKNAFFDRVEFIPQLVFPNPDPEDEIARLKNAG